jgi:inorganic pyrophosphatase
MSKKLKNAIAAPITLKPFNKQDASTIHVVIETPKGCRNKYKFDPELRSFRLNRVLPDGMQFPYDFGFVPSSQADDGDPADVLLLMDAPAFPGCVIESRLIGVIKGEQDEGGKKERNDRLIAVAKQSHTHSDLKDISDLNPALLKGTRRVFCELSQAEWRKIQGAGSKRTETGCRLARQNDQASKIGIAARLGGRSFEGPRNQVHNRRSCRLTLLGNFRPLQTKNFCWIVRSRTFGRISVASTYCAETLEADGSA